MRFVLFCVLAAGSASSLSAQYFRDLAAANQEFPTDYRSKCVGDVDGDGDLDLFFGRANPTPDLLLLNNGRGGFVDVSVTHLPDRIESTTGCAFGDIDGDGDLDLYVGRARLRFPSDSGQDKVFLNDGSGRFKVMSPGLPAEKDYGYSVALADIEGDKDLDVVVSQWTAGAAHRIFVNDGKGKLTLVTGRWNYAGFGDLFPADLDKDGDVDFFVSRISGGSTTLFNDGKGKFKEVPQSLGTTQRAHDAAVVDIDADGDPDICTSLKNGTRWRISVFVNDGKGAFKDEAATRLPTADNSLLLGLGDFDGDGDPDLISTADFTNSTVVRVARNDGKGRFTDLGNRVRDWPGPPRGPRELLSPQVLSLDTDRRVDLIYRGRAFLTNAAGYLVTQPFNLRIPIGHAVFTQAVAVGDVDGDGDPDLALGNRIRLPKAGDQNAVFLNDGHGYFHASATPRLPKRADETHCLELFDTNRDGKLDLLVGNDGRNYLYLGDGTGSFRDAPAGRLPGHRDLTRDIAVGDLNKDGHPDVVLASDGSRDRVYVGSGSGALWDSTNQWKLPNDLLPTRAVALGDIDADGDLDAVFGHATGPLRVFLNDEGKAFVDKTATALPTLAKTRIPVSRLQLLDWDGDKDLDLTIWPSGVVLENKGGVFSGRLSYTSYIGASGDSNGDGIVDVHYVASRRARVSDWNNPSRSIDVRVPTEPPDTGRRVVLADVDLDGDLDVFHPPFDGPYELFLNLRTQMDVPRSAMLGTDYHLDVYDMDPFLQSRVAAPFLAARLLHPRVSIGIPGLLALDPRAMLPLAPMQTSSTTGRARWLLPIPRDPTLAGIRFFGQSLLLGTPRLTNSIEDTVLR